MTKVERSFVNLNYGNPLYETYKNMKRQELRKIFAVDCKEQVPYRV